MLDFNIKISQLKVRYLSELSDLEIERKKLESVNLQIQSIKQKLNLLDEDPERVLWQEQELKRIENNWLSRAVTCQLAVFRNLKTNQP
jgi:Asp-tRNA(Asn)/Glu-tRNA(Gln) amidotransferase C subunit